MQFITFKVLANPTFLIYLVSILDKTVDLTFK